ncbi:efflux RND transporter periplasmic adaptor subunit [Pseudoalteromonas sp. SMS1]|uniref:efflux RND transporter periplasmic adaptor subunit n=1 Tax=Pseudoalteromonas sp. SMS1 TaxID=2908894 RepID=UPI001F1916E1|nr:efflux RND transporter periplasmic adaptor subunit [Pseudoalteromonas sp. SMS1]MCF2855882.1 efflux RND transporter periplasmic adaptor subunit [Pseudoalteromonas sp. SMS1]
MSFNYPLKNRLNLLYCVLLTGLISGCEDTSLVTPQKALVTQTKAITYAVPVSPPSKVFYGKVQSITGYDMASFNDGRVATVAVKEGQIVEKGQLLATLYSPSLDTMVLQTKAKLNAAIAASEEAEAERKRIANLYIQNLASISLLDNAQKNAKISAENVRQANAQLIKAKNDLKDISIYAPEAGLVAKLYARTGLFVAASEPILRFEQMGNQKITFSIPEQDAIKLNIGEKVEIFLRALNQHLQGRISEKALPDITGPSLFTVTVDLDKNAPSLLGLTAQMRLPLTNQPVFAIDSDAVRYSTKGKSYLLDNQYQHYSVTLLASRQDKLLVSAETNLENIAFSTTPEPTINLNLMTANEGVYDQ